MFHFGIVIRTFGIVLRTQVGRESLMRVCRDKKEIFAYLRVRMRWPMMKKVIKVRIPWLRGEGDVENFGLNISIFMFRVTL